MVRRAPANPRPDISAAGLTTEGMARILAAIAVAESKTAAEIRVVISSRPLVEHRFYSILWAALLALVVPWGLAYFFALRPYPLLAIQALIFVGTAGLLMIPALARRVVPRFAVQAAGRAEAVEQFLAQGIPQTEGRTGILILVAGPERLVEVVADEGVHAILGHDAWREICAVVATKAAEGDLAEGLVQGLGHAGDLLSRPLPRRAEDVNELSDHVIVI